jgi:flagellar FliL protein
MASGLTQGGDWARNSFVDEKNEGTTIECAQETTRRAGFTPGIGSCLRRRSWRGWGAAPAPLQFTVNLTTNQFLQVVMEFEFADPEVGQHLADFKPKVQHKLILLLSDLDVPRLLTSKGKIELQERIITELNSLLHATPKTGVKEVFFTSFIVQ